MLSGWAVLAEDYAPTSDIRVNGYNRRFQGQCKALQNHVVCRSHVQSAVDVDLLCCCGFIGLSLLISVCLRYTVWDSTWRRWKLIDLIEFHMQQSGRSEADSILTHPAVQVWWTNNHDVTSDAVDIDECAVNNGGCNAPAVCINTPGSFTCTYLPGYTGDGNNCSGKSFLSCMLFDSDGHRTAGLCGNKQPS